MTDKGNFDLDQLLTAEEVAYLLRVPKSWVYEHSTGDSEPRLPSVKLGKYLRFRRCDIEEFIRRVHASPIAHATNRR